jgi:hypothetical protein
MKAPLFITALAAAACIATSLQAARSDSAAASKQIDTLLVQSWQKHKITPNPLSMTPPSSAAPI